LRSLIQKFCLRIGRFGLIEIEIGNRRISQFSDVTIHLKVMQMYYAREGGQVRKTEYLVYYFSNSDREIIFLIFFISE
jgi:hypothetical protein